VETADKIYPETAKRNYRDWRLSSRHEAKY